MIDKNKWDNLLNEDSFIHQLSLKELEDLAKKHPYSYTIYLFLLKKRKEAKLDIDQSHLTKIGLLSPDPMHTSVSLRSSSESGDTFYKKNKKKTSTITPVTSENKSLKSDKNTKINVPLEDNLELQKTNHMTNDKKRKWTPFDKMLNAFLNIGKKTTENEVPSNASTFKETTIEEVEVKSKNDRSKVTYIEETRIESDKKIVQSKVSVSDSIKDVQVEELDAKGKEISILGKGQDLQISDEDVIPANIEDIVVSPLSEKVIDLKDAKQLKKEKKKAKKKKKKDKEIIERKEKSKKAKKKKKKDQKIKDSKKSKEKKKKSKKKSSTIEDKIKGSTIRKQGVGSETLANLMIQQGKIDEAKKIFQELMVKYPEKNSYFANLIKKLK